MFNLKTLETLTKLLDAVDGKPEPQQPPDPWEQPATVQQQGTGMGLSKSVGAAFSSCLFGWCGVMVSGTRAPAPSESGLIHASWK